MSYTNDLHVEKEKDGVILLKSKSRYTVAASMLRLQEFYESPNPDFRDHQFSLEDYMDWYAVENDNFTYYSDWSGFNVPGNVVREFFAINVSYDLLKKEMHIREILQPWLTSPDKFYVIAVSEEGEKNRDTIELASGETVEVVDEDNGLIDHELAHALYYLNPHYREEMDAITGSFKKKHADAVSAWLLDSGYCQDVVSDESQAYHATDTDELLIERFVKFPKKKTEAIRKTFKRYKKELNW